MPDADAIIGKVAVKVIPDTSGFKQKLKAKLKKIEEQTKDLQVTIVPKLDSKGLNGEVRRAVTAAERTAGQINLKVNIFDQESLAANIKRLEAELKKIDDRVIPVNLDKESIKREIEKFQKELARVAHIKLRVDKKSASSLESAISKIDAELRKLDEREVTYRLDRESLEKAKAELQKELAEAARLEITVNETHNGDLDNAIKQIDAELHKITQRTLSIKMDEESLRRERDRLQKIMDDAAEVRLHLNQAAAQQVLDDIDRRIGLLEFSPELDKKEMRKQVAAIEREMLRLNDLEFKVQTEFDPIARRKLEREIAEVQATINAVGDWKIKAILDKDAAAKALANSQRLVDEIQSEIDRLKINFKRVDKNDIAKIRREIQSELLKFHDLRIRLEAELDPLAAMKIDAEMAGVEANLRSLKLKLDPEISHKERFEAQLAWLARARDVVYNPKLNKRAAAGVAAALSRLSGFRLAHEEAEKLRETLFNLDKAVPKIGMVATAVGGLGAMATSSAANLFALSAALAQIAQGLSLALPGAFVSLGVAVGVTALALKDFKKVLPDVAKQFKGLQKTISRTFWKQAEEPLRRMATKLFPEIEKGVTRVSTASGKFFANFSDSIREILGGKLDGMFKNVADGITLLSKHTDAFATIFGVLGRVGSQFFQDMMGELGKAADGWAEWLTEAEKTGKLRKMIDNAVTGVKNLWRILKGVAGIWSGIARAAQRALGKDILDSWADSLERVHKIVDSPEFQKELTEVFRSARKAMEEITKRAGPALEKAFKNLGDLVEDVFPVIGSIIGEVVGGVADAFNNPTLQTNARNFFDALQDFAEALRPAWDDIGGAIGSVLGLIDSFITTATPGVGTAIQNLAGWISELAEALKPIAEGLGTALSDMLEAVSPGIDRIVGAISDFAKSKGGQALVGIFEDLAPLLGEVADFLGDVAEALGGWLQENLPRIREDLKKVFDALGKFIDDHGDTIVSVLMGIADGLLAIFDVMSDLAPLLDELVVGFVLFKLAKGFRELGIAIGLFNGAAAGGAVAGAAGAGAKTGLFGWIAGLIAGGGWRAAIARIGALGLAVAGFLAIKDTDMDKNGSPFWKDLLFGGSGKDSEQIDKVKKWIGERFSGIGKWFTVSLPNWFSGVDDWFNDTFGSGGSIDGWVSGDSLGASFGGMLDGFSTRFDDWKLLFDGNWGGFWQGLPGNGPGTAAPKSKEDMDKMVTGLTDSLMGWIPGFKGEYITGFSNMLSGQKGSTSGMLADILGFFGVATSESTAGYTKMEGEHNKGWGNMKTSADSGLASLVQKVSGGFLKLGPASEDGIGDLQLNVEGIKDALPTWIGDLGSTLKNAGLSVIGGFISGIEERFSDVQTSLSNLTDLLPDWKGPASRDKTILFDAGSLVIDGFINGLESRYDAVRKSLKGLTSEVAGTPFAAGSVGVSGALGGLAAQSGGGSQRVLNYYAAPGSSLSNEEDLFSAAGRARMVW